MKSSIDRKVSYALQRDGSTHKDADGNEDWTPYCQETIDMTDEYHTIAKEFQMKEDTDPETIFNIAKDVDVWYDSTKIPTTPHNNMTELYFEDNDIEGIIEKLGDVDGVDDARVVQYVEDQDYDAHRDGHADVHPLADAGRPGFVVFFRASENIDRERGCQRG